jgi:hypothetical protein
MDPQVLTLHALNGMSAGDTLVVALEPGPLTAPIEPTALGIHFSFAVGHPEWVCNPALDGRGASRSSALLALRPGARHTFTLLGKLLSRGSRSLYRYRVEDANPSGWNRTAVRRELDGPPGHDVHLSDDGRRLLGALRRWCDEKQVKVVYSLPWAYVPEEKMASFQHDNARFLLEMLDYLPVLKNARLGAHSLRSDFSDTSWHLSEAGSKLRTAELGEALETGRLWKAEELRSHIRALTPITTNSP